MKMPRARAAVDSEWSSLADSGAWDPKSVQPRSKVIADAKRKGRTVHFGSLMDLCHEKNSELFLPDDKKVYKGRVVFRGDQVKDEDGAFAVFTEQSASASHMAAAKYLDAIGRFPGHISEDSDAVKAYRQVFLDELNDLLGNSRSRRKLGLHYRDLADQPGGTRSTTLYAFLNVTCTVTRSQV